MRNRWRQCAGRGCNRRMGQFLDPSLLLLLEQAPAHGYTLLGRMAEFGLDFLTPTVVYRTLREMEEKGWVSSTWDSEETQGPPRRVYALTPLGREILACCVSQLQNTQQVLEYILALHNELAPQSDPEKVERIIINEEAPMRIVIPSNGTDLNAPTSPVFGRCPVFMFVNPETLDFEALPNPALSAPGGAGVQAMQTVLQHGALAIIASRLGPNAFRVIQAADVPVYALKGATVREAVEAYNAGQLEPIEAPGAGHVGLGQGHRHGHAHSP